jgi:Uma2 family endonuclease
VVPDWICEITSPSNVALDRVKKRQLYAKDGVAWYWIVDPSARTLEAIELKGTTWIEVGSWGDDDMARIAPFDGIELEVSRLFPPRPPTESSAM